MWYDNEGVPEEEGVSKLLVGKTFAYFPDVSDDEKFKSKESKEDQENDIDEADIDNLDKIIYNNKRYALITQRLGRTIIPLNPHLLAESASDQEMIDKYLDEIHDNVNKYSILTEYSLLLKGIPKNFYCLPQSDNLLTWDLFIIIYSTYYKYGKFKLKMCLDENYPHSAPQVFFLTPIYHPLVNPQTGKLNLGTQLNKWNSSTHCMSLVFLHMKKMFYLQDEYSNEIIENEEAYFLFNNDKEEFLKKVRNSVEESNKMLYEQIDNFMFNFEKDVERTEINEKLKNITKEKNCTKKTEAFIFWLLNEYLENVTDDLNEQGNGKNANIFGEKEDAFSNDFVESTLVNQLPDIERDEASPKLTKYAESGKGSEISSEGGKAEYKEKKKKKKKKKREKEKEKEKEKEMEHDIEC